MADSIPYYSEPYDLTNCESEPLINIQRAQSYGELLLCDLNFKHWYYASEILAKAISTTSIIDLVKELTGLDLNTLDISSNTTFIEGHPKNLIIHRNEAAYTLELEPNAALGGIKLSTRQLQQSILTISREYSFQEFIDKVCTEVRNITEYDHVMVYQFDENYDGKVIEEKKTEERPTYLGLKFPNTDIPKQARDLYFHEQVRIVYDTSGTQTDIYSNTLIKDKPALDLKGVSIRGVSPIHLEYLRNMKVSSSFSVAIIHENKLWGLIACHHTSKKFINYEIRDWLKFVSSIISSNLSKLFKYNSEVSVGSKKLLRKQILEKILASKDLADSLLNSDHSIMNLIESDGAILKMGSDINCSGNIDIDSLNVELENLFEWLSQQEDFNVKVINDVKSALPNYDFGETIASMLIVQLSHLSGDYIIWTRQEKQIEIQWAGVISKDKHFDAAKNRLTPRKSFEKWKQLEGGKAKEWTTQDIEVAAQLKREIREYLYERYNEMTLLNQELKEAYEEMETFSYSVSHDLKAPLRSIEGFAQILKEDYHTVLDEHGLQLLDIITSSIAKMNDFIADILKFSKLNRENLHIMKVNLNDLLDQEWRIIKAIKEHENAVLIKPDLPTVYGDVNVISQIFANLMGNSIKYVLKGEHPKIEIQYYEKEGFLEIHLYDNGIGIPPQSRSKVFEVFRRLVADEEYPGTGVGLSIVKKGINRHGGTIKITDGINEKGTGFIFTLPTNAQFLELRKNKTIN